MAEQFNWVSFYTEFANVLLAYRVNRMSLLDGIQHTFARIGMKLPRLDKSGLPDDIDPFTIFGLFNKGLSNDKRIAIIKGFKEEFGIRAEVPDDFPGIPVLNNLSATFYGFEGDRKENDIENLWEVFEAALAYADNGNETNRAAFVAAYNQAITQFAVKWNLSMGLFWIRPNTYLNLDSRNRWYMSDPKNLPATIVVEVKSLKDTVPDADKYLSLCEKCREAIATGNCEYKSFLDLSYKAWVVSEEVNKQIKNDPPAKTTISNASFLQWFKPLLQALRDLGGSATPVEARAKVAENEHLTKEQLNETRGKTNVRKIDDDIAWARNYLRSAGYIDGSVRGIWTLTDMGWTVEMTDQLASQIQAEVQAKLRESTTEQAQTSTLGDDNVVHYWLYAPGESAVKWEEFYKKGIMAIGWPELGDLNLYDDKADITQRLQELNENDSSFKMSVLAVWQFAHDVKPGDIVFVKKGRTEILGRGQVLSGYVYDEEKQEYPHYHQVQWMEKGSWQLDNAFAMKCLTDITNMTDFVEKLNALFDKEDGDEKKIPVPPLSLYGPEQFLDEAYIDEEQYWSMVGVLQSKKNLILQGAPGVGKTFVAKRLAYSIMGVKDPERVMMVQFHQSYSYEDFVMGFRPVEGGGFKLKYGAFYKFCKKAEEDSENDYFFIIDEINRGNLSKIFGELFMLIENDKRGNKNRIQLLYSDEYFFIPENVYLIGMMNTADRSLAMMDYALRRRFGFFDLHPAFSQKVFKDYQASLESTKLDKLIYTVEDLNNAIREDESLGEGFCIGHSYFCNLEEVTDQALAGIVEYELTPLLQEYWYDDRVKANDWIGHLRDAIR